MPLVKTLDVKLYRRSKALQSLCFLFTVVMTSLNKISYLILSYVGTNGRTLNDIGIPLVPIARLVLSPYNVYRDRYRLMKMVQIWTVRFRETSMKFAIFSKVL